MGNSIGADLTHGGAAVFTGFMTAMFFVVGSPTGMDGSTFGLWGKDKDGNNEGGPGDVMGKANSDGADGVGQALGSYLDGQAPNGTPVDIGDGRNE